MASIEIHSVQSVSGNQPRVRRMAEKALQTFLFGTPVMIDVVTGFIQAWDGLTIANGLAGFSKDFGANLTTSGVALQPIFGPSGIVPNQTLAQNISRPYANDGLTGFEVAAQDTVFLAQVGPAQTALVTDLGKQYGLTKDTDNHWFVDKNKNTVGTNTMVTIVKLDPNDQSATPRGVYFVVVSTSAQAVA